MAEALEEGALDDPAIARDFVHRMHQEIDGLAQLTNELLTLTRIESGAETLTLAPQSPDVLLTDCARRMGPLAARADVTLLVEPGDAPPVRADAERVAQVLANLVHNAVKFTPAGGAVRLSAERADGRVAFSVADTGVGIERADLGRVFERFYKADRSRSGGGTGLGLAIAKHIVQAHGGSIEASSDGPGRGATFRFTLPLAERSPAPDRGRRRGTSRDLTDRYREREGCSGTSCMSCSFSSSIWVPSSSSSALVNALRTLGNILPSSSSLA